MSNALRIGICLLSLHLTLSMARADRDPLADTKARLAIEAQRLEKDFAAGRAEAYKLARATSPRLLDATEKLRELLVVVRNDISLDPKRREVFIVTLKADLDRVKEIASQREKSQARSEEVLRSRVTRDEASRSDTERRGLENKRVSDDARSIIESRAASLLDSRDMRRTFGDRFNKTLAKVDDAAIPEHRDIRFPKDWVERTKKRSSAVKLTAQERAIMKALGSTIDVDFSKNTFEEVVDYLRKKMGVEIIVDKRALEEASVTYESQVNLKLRASGRTILKRMLADLNLAYVIKDDAIQITSRERANQLTTTRTYYIGDLASVVDIRLPQEVTYLLMLQNVNNIMNQITTQVDPQSWKTNNPDAAGSIAFDPVTMTLVVKQTAEVHYMLGGYR